MQLIVGIALTTARSDDAGQAGRLLALTLDAVLRKPGPPTDQGPRTGQSTQGSPGL